MCALLPDAVVITFILFDELATIFLVAILLAPLEVFLQGGIGGHFWLNILLTILGYIPGIIHAIWILLKR